MNKNLISYLKKLIDTEFVSVYHNYDTLETVYSIPYNASLASDKVKLILIRALGLDWDDNFNPDNPDDIAKMSWFMLSDGVPVFALTSTHLIDKHGNLKTHFILDFEDEILFEKSYKTQRLTDKNPMVKLMHKISTKVIAQEHEAQKLKMEKMFISTNMFLPQSTR